MIGTINHIDYKDGSFTVSFNDNGAYGIFDFDSCRPNTTDYPVTAGETVTLYKGTIRRDLRMVKKPPSKEMLKGRAEAKQDKAKARAIKERKEGQTEPRPPHSPRPKPKPKTT